MKRKLPRLQLCLELSFVCYSEFLELVRVKKVHSWVLLHQFLGLVSAWDNFKDKVVRDKHNGNEIAVLIGSVKLQLQLATKHVVTAKEFVFLERLSEYRKVLADPEIDN